MSKVVFIALISLLFALDIHAQRITFEDPGLTFSLKKPKGWEVFDNGYVVLISPSAKDTATTFFSITYFEDAKPIGDSYVESDLIQVQEQKPKNLQPNPFRIAKEESAFKEESIDEYLRTTYTFTKFDQQFFIITNQVSATDNKRQINFRRMLKSIRVSQ